MNDLWRDSGKELSSWLGNWNFKKIMLCWYSKTEENIATTRLYYIPNFMIRFGSEDGEMARI